MYSTWQISRWETPVVDMSRLLMVSLTDARQELIIVLEDARSLARARWQVTFRGYPAYRNIDESYRLALWRWLDESGQRCGFTFTVEETPRLASWHTGHLHVVSANIRHFVVATEDDVIEILSTEEPSWHPADAGRPEEPRPGKAHHLYRGEDDAEIGRLLDELKGPGKPGDAD